MAEQLPPRTRHKMSSDGTGGDGGSDTVTIGTPTNDMVPKSEEKDEQLLPGILNDITLNHIATKLPWRALYILSLVSPCWQGAIRSRLVHDARVRTHSTETLVGHGHDICGGSGGHTLALFSMRDKRCYELPPIPLLDGRISYLWKCVSLDGKVYALGGWKEYDYRHKYFVGPENSAHGGNELYVLDLVGQRHWKQCASMQRQRHRFGCGAVDGKIYVLGGVNAYLVPLPGSEVYDPNVDAWSEIMPMPRLRSQCQVDVVGDDFFVHGGKCFDPAYTQWVTTEYNPNDNRRHQDFIQGALFANVYHPVKDEWRVVDSFRRYSDERLFVAYGEFYSMTRQGICIYDSVSKSWKDLHSHTFPAVGPIDSTVIPCSAVGLNGEILALVYWFSLSDLFNPSVRRDIGAHFIKSKGFGGKNRAITWQIVSNCSSSSKDAMCSIEL